MSYFYKKGIPVDRRSRLLNALPPSVKKAMDIRCDYESKRLYSRKLSGNIALKLALSQDEKFCVVEITDNTYMGRFV